MRQIPALTVQTGKHHMQVAAIAPVGASLLASFSTKPRRARETRVVQRKHAADPSPHPPDRKAPHADGCNCTCRSELVSRAFQPCREELARQGLCSANMRQIPALTVQTGRHPMQVAAIAPVGASLSRELFNATAKSSLLQGQAISLRSSKQSRACQSVSSGHGFSGTLTSTVLLPAARPQSRSKR